MDKLNADGYYGRPSFMSHSLNLSLGFLYLFMNHAPASGSMAELGLSYRLGVKMIDSYRLKDRFYE